MEKRENQFYTIDKIAEILGLHPKTIRKFITEGKLSACKVGKQWKISGHDLSAFMEENNVNISDNNIDEKSNRLRVLLRGSISFIYEMLSSISMLME